MTQDTTRFLYNGGFVLRKRLNVG
uniref:Uncharacterized protein n=1 Tax=Lepeophtheirus salmonis TaxID=72036 RepID=A0A0K2V1G5_LEPSM